MYKEMQPLGDAFVTACQQIRDKYGKFAGVFAVLVDTSDLTRSDRMKAFYLNASSTLSFAPFVLIHTMDAMLEAHVQKADEDDAHRLRRLQQCVISLESGSRCILMGRPLWKSCYDRLGFNGVINLAASKLLCRCSPADPRGFNAQSMNGVASMLCRLGVRPQSWSPLSELTVAHTMAVMHAVIPPSERVISTFESEPVLAFGASRVWYLAANESDHHLILHRHILPELCRLIQEESLDTGRADVVVARIVLLLAMDTVGAAGTGDRKRRCYAGEFHDVWTFLGVLHGGATTVEDKNGRDLTAASVADLVALQLKWSGWNVGFSHFVQLTDKPNKECLWDLLVRRAAGVFPREFNCVELVTPVFKDTEISMILVAVSHGENCDLEFPGSTLAAT